MKKFIALFLAALCLLSFAACSPDVDLKDDGNVNVEDGEDSGVEKATVTIANMTGQDAVSLLARQTGSEEWSDNILSQDYLHNEKAVEITYNKSENDVYDLKLVFEDGTYQEFESIDFAQAKSIIYLQKPEEK